MMLFPAGMKLWLSDMPLYDTSHLFDPFINWWFWVASIWSFEFSCSELFQASVYVNTASLFFFARFIAFVLCSATLKCFSVWY